MTEGDQTIIGYVPVCHDGSPYRTEYQKSQFHAVRRNPPRLYRTERMAKRQSPVGFCRAVGCIGEWKCEEVGPIQ